MSAPRGSAGARADRSPSAPPDAAGPDTAAQDTAAPDAAAQNAAAQDAAASGTAAPSALATPDAGAPAPGADGGARERFNVASYLAETAARRPGLTAIRAARGRGRGPDAWDEIDYAGLARRAAAIARGLERAGLAPLDRVCVFVRPGIDLVAVTYALFAAGAVPVLIDPGMGLRNVLRCVRTAAPRGFVGVPAAFVVRALARRAFASVELAVVVGPLRVPGALTLAELEAEGAPPAGQRSVGLGSAGQRSVEQRPAELRPADTAAADTAAILFTSGSTGPPKGVVYAHGTFRAQVEALSAAYGFGAGETDVACFPLFALFDAAFETTCVFPRLDPSRPGRCDPARIVAAIRANRATTAFASPAVWRRVAPWCAARGIVLDTLRRVTTAGAPIPPGLVAELARVLPEGAVIHTPYGATEALPVASITGAEILGGTRALVEAGAGTCVGAPVPVATVRAIAVTDSGLERWSADLALPPGTLGELCVRGPAVTRAYAFEPAATRAAKIADGAAVWHRMGDLGWIDAAGRVWFCGRKNHRLETAAGLVPPVPAENVFNAHPDVLRTALVGVGPRGAERPVLVVEPRERRLARRPLRARDRSRRAALTAELERIAERLRAAPAPAGVPAGLVPAEPLRAVLFHGGFPVDVRHNAKIHRGELARWAARRLGERAQPSQRPAR